MMNPRMEIVTVVITNLDDWCDGSWMAITHVLIDEVVNIWRMAGS